MGKFDNVPVELIYLGETERAVRFEDEDGEIVWLPKSQISWHGEPVENETLLVDMPEWLAMDKDLI